MGIEELLCLGWWAYNSTIHRSCLRGKYFDSLVTIITVLFLSEYLDVDGGSNLLA